MQEPEKAIRENRHGSKVPEMNQHFSNQVLMHTGCIKKHIIVIVVQLCFILLQNHHSASDEIQIQNSVQNQQFWVYRLGLHLNESARLKMAMILLQNK